LSYFDAKKSLHTLKAAAKLTW